MEVLSVQAGGRDREQQLKDIVVVDGRRSYQDRTKGMKDATMGSMLMFLKV
jgi:hypothetical protein